MRKRLVTLAVIGAWLSGCQAVAPALPWLHGLSDVVTSRADLDVGLAAPDDSELGAGCGAGALRRIQLVADVAPAAGRELVIASYANGVVIFGREHQRLYATAGYPCDGSGDELVTIASGRAYGEPTLVITAVTGGRHEADTWLALYRPGVGGRLDEVFTGVVEHRVGDQVERGEIWLVPDGLLYRRPGGPTTLWLFDPVGRAYVPMGRPERETLDHADPGAV